MSKSALGSGLIVLVALLGKHCSSGYGAVQQLAIGESFMGIASRPI